MGMLIFIVVMMFSGLKESFNEPFIILPEKFPKGAEKVRLGYFEHLYTEGIHGGELIKLNDGRVLIYNSNSINTYIFDPKDDCFWRIKNKDAQKYYRNSGYTNAVTQYGIALNNGKVLLLASRLEESRKLTELIYYDRNIYCNTPEWDLIQKYFENKTEENKLKAINYIRKNRKDLYDAYLKYKKCEENSQHSYLYNPDLGTMEQLAIAPLPIYPYSYKLLLKDGRVLIINSSRNSYRTAVIFNPDTNIFTALPSAHKLLGYSGYEVLATGDIFMFDGNDIPYLYNFETDTLIKKRKITEMEGYRSNAVQLKDSTLCYVYQSEKENSNVVCYNPYTEKSTSTRLFNAYTKQFSQILTNEIILITGKSYSTYDITGKEEKREILRADKHVKVYNPTTNEVKVMTRKTHIKHTASDSKSILLDDGRVLFLNKDYSVVDFELFIPYTYKKQKREEQKRLKQELKNK